MTRSRNSGPTAKETASERREKQRDDAALPRTQEELTALVDKARRSGYMSGLATKGATPPSVQPSAAPDPADKIEVRRDTFDAILRKAAGVEPAPMFMDPGVDEPVPDVTTLQKEDTRRAYQEATRLRYEKEALKSANEIEKMSAGGSESEALRSRVDQLERQLAQAAIDQKFTVMQSQMAAWTNDVKNEVASLRQTVSLAMQSPKTENGHSTIADSIALAQAIAGQKQDPLQTLEFFLNKGIVASPSGQPQTELMARVQLASEKMRVDATRELQKEQREAATGDKLVDLANRAISTIAEPVSKAVGESIKGGARAPPGTAPPVPAAQPPTRAEQIQQLQQLEQRAKSVREELERQEPSSNTPSEPIGGAIARAVSSPSPMMSTPIEAMPPAPPVGGQIHSRGRSP